MNVGRDMLRKGEGEYQLSVTAKDSALIDPDRDYKSRDQDSVRFVGLYEYGLSQSLSLGAGIQSQEVNGLRREYINTGVKATLGPVFTGGDYVHDTRGGDAAEIFAQTGRDTGLGPVDLRLKQQIFNDFKTENTSDADPVKFRTSASLSGELKELGGLPDIPYTLTYSRSQKKTSEENRLSSNLGINFGRTYFNNRLDWSDGLGYGTPNLEGELRATGYIEDVRLRSAMNYQLAPDAEIEEVEFSTQFTPLQDLNTELFVKADFRNKDTIGGGVRLNWNNGKYILSPQVSYGSDGEFLATIALTTSFGAGRKKNSLKMTSQRQTNTGRIAARVFHDRNNNNIFDQKDTVIKGAEVSAVQARQNARTDEEGIALVSGLKKYRTTDVVVKGNSLEDPFMAPSGKGVSVVPRPGHTTVLDIPVTLTGEIEGTISLGETADASPMPNARLQLIDHQGKVVDETRSEFDGFYLFLKVPPGKYSVRLHPDHADRLGVAADIKEDIKIDSEGGVVGGMDMVAHKTTPPNISPEPEPIAISPIEPFLTMADALPVSKKIDSVSGNKLSLSGGRVPNEDKATPALQKRVPVTEVSALASKNDDIPFSGQRYGIHMASYRTPEKAVAGISYLKKQFPEMLDRFDYTVQKIDLGPEKGEWFRVVAGNFDSQEAASDVGKKIRMAGPYCKVVAIGQSSGSGVHLTSFRTRAKAWQSIEELKSEYPELLGGLPFTVKTVDLGREQGVWQRVIAGNFFERASAVKLAQKIKLAKPYTKVVSLEKQSDYGVHLASFRDPENAKKGLALIEKKLGGQIGDEPRYIRRVDLGPKKGVWYRIMAGRFADRKRAAVMQNSLAKTGQYAEILDL